MSVLALIPARSGSKQIAGKNLRELGGRTLIQRAIMCAVQADIWPVYITSDIQQDVWQRDGIEAYHIQRPADLASDTAAMVDVVTHALAQIPGPDDQIILLLQPTQPFRTPEHVKQAFTLLQESGADSVVSVVELPRTHHPRLQAIVLQNERLMPYEEWDGAGWSGLPARRQDVSTTYIRDGTCYAFRRSTVSRYGTIYGQDVRPLIIPPEQSCELDTEADWERVEARWRARG